jgi:hypoxanthine phosphoribosyltransferase
MRSRSRSEPLSASDCHRPEFAHPAEGAFARILDFYGIEWEYEPRTFPLEWDEQGNIVEAFAPDFYLPQQDLYVELTTLRPQLSTHKNRKLRRMKELYPEVNVKLFKRREMRDLMTKYGLMQEAEQIRGTGAQKREA